MNGMKMLQRVKEHLGVLPSIIAMLLLFWSGILNSFKRILNAELWDRVISQGDFVRSLLYTFRISIFSVVNVALLSFLGIYILYLLSTEVSLRKLNLMKILVISPMYIPYLLGGYMISTLIAPSGVISTIFYKLGWISGINEFPILVSESRGYSIIFTYGWKASPFVILMVYSTILKINKEWLDVARVYGINRTYFFRKVVFPIIFPVYVGALFIVFAHIFASFEVPYLLGVTYPRTLPVLAYVKYARDCIKNYDEVMLINSIIVIVTISIAFAIFTFNKLFKERVELELEK